MADGRHYGEGGEAPQRAKRAVLHRVAEIGENIDRGGVSAGDSVDRLDAPPRADTARRAFAAALDGAELHGETRHLHHIDGIVEYDDPGMADQAALSVEFLIAERRVEQGDRHIGAERAADLHRLDRSARGGAA